MFSGHLLNLQTQYKDLEDIEEIYQQDPKCGFWVAEAWESSLKDKTVKFVNQQEMSRLQEQGQLMCGKNRLVGTVAVRMKVDKDLSEPPGTVGEYAAAENSDDDIEDDNSGLLERLLVVPDCRSVGVAQELVLSAWGQCVHHLRAVELQLDANNHLARKFFEKQDWALVSVMETQTLGFIKVDKMIYRRPCKRSLDDTL